MFKLIDRNYYRLNLAFISIIAVYCMCGLIVPLQSISANKIVAGVMTLFGVFLAIYNILVKKVYLKIKAIEYLILFFIFNIITCLIVISYGFSTNIKNMIIFFIYFFTIFPMFSSISRDQGKKIFGIFFLIITTLNTFGVLISLIQFILLKGYRVHDYKGLLIRQGFIESRLFGILASPNYLSIISLIVVIFLVVRLRLLNNSYRYLVYIVIAANFIYIVLSGSRTTYICLILASLIYALVIFYKKNNLKSLGKVILSVAIVFISYKGINFISEKYLEYNKATLQENMKEEKNLSLERTDTSEENISNNRFAIWKSTATFIPKKPILGYSAGNWYEVGKKINPDEYIIREHYLTHNGYLEILFYNGLVGFISMAIFILTFLKTLLKKIYKFRKEKGVEYNQLVMILMITLVIFVSNLFLSSTLYGISLLGIILFLSVGYFFSILNESKQGYRKLTADEIKEVELGIMDYIHNICQKNNINYSLAYGTLLGAVRHNGFIPWDDDIDISLSRQEYDKLYKAIEKDNNNIYKVISYKNNSNYPYPFYRVYDSRTVYENGYINSDIELGICVDVFPFDTYKEISTEMRKLDTFRQLSVYTFYGIRDKNSMLNNVIRYLLVLIFRCTRVKTWNKKMNELSKKEAKDEYIDYLMEKKKSVTKVDANSLDNVIDASFEGRKYKIPEKYDHILSTIYGNDYMEIPPLEKRVQHDDFIAYIKKEG